MLQAKHPGKAPTASTESEITGRSDAAGKAPGVGKAPESADEAHCELATDGTSVNV